MNESCPNYWGVYTNGINQKNSSEEVFSGQPFDNIDSETLLLLKEKEFEHLRTIERMKNEEKQKERDFEREKREFVLIQNRVKTNSHLENEKLKNQLSNLESEIEHLKHLKEEEEKETIDPLFELDFNEFISDMISWDRRAWEAITIENQFKRIIDMQELLYDWCTTHEYDHEDFNQWQLLEYAKNDLQLLNTKLSNKLFSSSIQFWYTTTLKEMLNQFV